MIKHVVLFKLASFAEGKSKQENALCLKSQLEALESLIPELLKMEVFINMPTASRENYDLMLISKFESLADLSVYANHPDHQKVVSFISKIKTERVAIDYEV